LAQQGIIDLYQAVALTISSIMACGHAILRFSRIVLSESSDIDPVGGKRDEQVKRLAAGHIRADDTGAVHSGRQSPAG
jgi:hypothetical protein